MESTTSQKILIIDDDEDDFLIIKDLLKKIANNRFIIAWTPTYEKGLEEIITGKHDIYIIDYQLGAENGLSLIEEANRNNCKEPMILLTGVENKFLSEKASDFGVFDFLVKNSLSSERLEHSIRYALGQAKMQKEVLENERRYRTIFEKSSDAIFIAELDGTIININEAGTNLLNIEKNQLINTHIQAFMTEATWKELLASLSTVEPSFSKNIELIPHDSDPIPCYLMVSLQFQKNQKLYIQGVIQDLSLVTREAQNKLMFEKLDATGRFMKMLAHEVRNPLTNISLSADGLLSELKKHNDLMEYAHIIQRNSKRIGDLITSLLQSSHPKELELIPISLPLVIEHTLELMHDRFTLKEVTIQFEKSEKDLFILGNEGHLKIAFTNFLVNAIEAVEAKTGKILVKITATENDAIEFRIIDNGVGIEQQNLDKLFEPFFTSKNKGMGLGLATSLTIVKAHKASIQVQSRLYFGTTFILTFPIYKRNNSLGKGKPKMG